MKESEPHRPAAIAKTEHYHYRERLDAALLTKVWVESEGGRA